MKETDCCGPHRKHLALPPTSSALRKHSRASDPLQTAAGGSAIDLRSAASLPQDFCLLKTSTVPIRNLCYCLFTRCVESAVEWIRSAHGVRRGRGLCCSSHRRNAETVAPRSVLLPFLVLRGQQTGRPRLATSFLLFSLLLSRFQKKRGKPAQEVLFCLQMRYACICLRLPTSPTILSVSWTMERKIATRSGIAMHF